MGHMAEETKNLRAKSYISMTLRLLGSESPSSNARRAERVTDSPFPRNTHQHQPGACRSRHTLRRYAGGVVNQDATAPSAIPSNRGAI